MSEDLVTYALTRDPALRGRLAVIHLPLVKFVARKMSRSLPAHMDIDDLISWGSIGLLDAIDKFDPTRQIRFSTYAVTRIRGAILDGLQAMDWAPKQVTSKVRALRRVKELLTNELGFEPTVAQTAAHMGIDVGIVRGWLLDDHIAGWQPLERDDDEMSHRWDKTSVLPEQETAGEVAEIRCLVAAAVERLEAREQDVLLLYYRDSLTLREIATQLGVSVSSVTQTHTRLVEQVKNRLQTSGGRV